MLLGDEVLAIYFSKKLCFLLFIYPIIHMYSSEQRMTSDSKMHLRFVNV